MQIPVCLLGFFKCLISFFIFSKYHFSAAYCNHSPRCPAPLTTFRDLNPIIAVSEGAKGVSRACAAADNAALLQQCLLTPKVLSHFLSVHYLKKY